MRILITNDDGIHAEGLRLLAAEVSKEHSVTVVAPDMQCSACGHAVTMHAPLMVKKAELSGLKGVAAYCVNGTPADCVKLAVSRILREPPDIVLSGVNNGANAGTDVLYSGTVSGAMEGVILGIRSAAVSAGSDRPGRLEEAARFAGVFLRRFDWEALPTGVMLNVNLPDLPLKDIRGLAATPQGILQYASEFCERSHPRGYTYYWMAGEPVLPKENGEDTDVRFLSRGFAVVTPLRFDLTDYDALRALQGAIRKIPLQDGPDLVE